MTTIHDLIEQVKEREAAAEAVVDAARSEAARLLAEAAREGRVAHDRVLATAREEGDRLLVAASEESRRERERLAGETREALLAVDRQAERHFDEAVTWLLDQFRTAYGPPREP